MPSLLLTLGVLHFGVSSIFQHVSKMLSCRSKAKPGYPEVSSKILGMLYSLRFHWWEKAEEILIFAILLTHNPLRGRKVLFISLWKIQMDGDLDGIILLQVTEAIEILFSILFSCSYWEVNFPFFFFNLFFFSSVNKEWLHPYDFFLKIAEGKYQAVLLLSFLS